MERLHAAVELLGDAPEEFRSRAFKAVMDVVSDYEDWISEGRPRYWYFVKMMRHQKTNRRRLLG